VGLSAILVSTCLGCGSAEPARTVTESKPPPATATLASAVARADTGRAAWCRTDECRAARHACEVLGATPAMPRAKRQKLQKLRGQHDQYGAFRPGGVNGKVAEELRSEIQAERNGYIRACEALNRGELTDRNVNECAKYDR
jgi:hypothetical protein